MGRKLEDDVYKDLVSVEGKGHSAVLVSGPVVVAHVNQQP